MPPLNSSLGMSSPLVSTRKNPHLMATLVEPEYKVLQGKQRFLQDPCGWNAFSLLGIARICEEFPFFLQDFVFRLN